MKVILDSYAWVEYLDGSDKGWQVKKIIEKAEKIYTLSLSITEVVSRMKRLNRDFEIAYKVMISNSKVLDINPKIAKESGEFHAEIRKKIKNFGLVDSLLFISAKKLGAKIITGDKHFKNFKEVIYLK